MSKKEVKLIDRIVNEINRIVESEDLLPHQITKSIIVSETDITEWELRKVGGLSNVLKTFFPMTDKELVSLKQMKDVNKYVTELENKLTLKLSGDESFIKSLSKLPKIKINSYKQKAKKKNKRVLNLILSDLHIGSDINAEETGKLTFGKTEEARRLAAITKKVLDYKKEHRNETKLNVILLGDLIQGNLGHDPRDGAPLTEQFARALHLLSQQLAHFSEHFPEVDVYFNSGNHGRNTSRHKDRAVHQKWDSIETMLALALKESLKQAKNLKFIIPKTPYVEYIEFGKKYMFTHGDTVIKAPYPGKAISVQSLETQINRINAALHDKDEYSVIGIGHVHVGSQVHLSNGAVMITNGAMVPVDEFAISIGMVENVCGQYMFESVENYPVGDSLFIKVGVNDDKNSELDRIISPWEKM